MQHKIQFYSDTSRKWHDADERFEGSLDYVRGILTGWQSCGVYGKHRIRMTDETRDAYLAERDERRHKCYLCGARSDAPDDMCNDCYKEDSAREQEAEYAAGIMTCCGQHRDWGHAAYCLLFDQ